LQGFQPGRAFLVALIAKATPVIANGFEAGKGDGAKVNAVNWVGVFYMTPRKSIFHDEMHESYGKKFLGPCL
jgi:hypothetical protein